MKKQQLNKSAKAAKKAKQNAIVKKNNLHGRLAKPKDNADLPGQPVDDTEETTINHPSMENEVKEPEQEIVQEVEQVTQVKETKKDSNINLEDSGFFEPVIERAYAENPQTQVVDKQPVAEIPVQEPVKPTVVFGPKLTLKTDDAYKKAMGDETVTENQEPEIPTMQYQEANFNLADDAQPLGRQIGQEAGNTTSEWAFGMLENFYPEVVAFFTKIPTDWVEKAKLPNALEAQMLQDILTQNAKNKNRVKISDFHKKNILPPLKRILEKKGWENVMPDELLLVIGLVVLAADSYFKIQEIKKDNKVLEKKLKQKIQDYIDIRTEERKEIDSLKGELGEMRTFFANMKNAQAQPAAA